MIVTMLNVGPQDANVNGLAVKLIFVGLLTLVFRVIGPVTSGAHLNDSPALPALPIPALTENVTLSGFIDQRAFGLLMEAKPTAA